jgi:transcription elongation factor GreB
VTYEDDLGVRTQVTILGIDEVDTAQQQISWVSPVAQVLLKSRVGDVLRLRTPGGFREIEVLAVQYPAPAPIPAPSADAH